MRENEEDLYAGIEHWQTDQVRDRESTRAGEGEGKKGNERGRGGEEREEKRKEVQEEKRRRMEEGDEKGTRRKRPYGKEERNSHREKGVTDEKTEEKEGIKRR